MLMRVGQVWKVSFGPRCLPMIGWLEKFMNTLVVVASWNDISDLFKFWWQAHFGAGLPVSRSMLASCCYNRRPTYLVQGV